MAGFGTIMLIVSFAASFCSFACLLAEWRLNGKATSFVKNIGHAAGAVSCASLGLCCIGLAACFFVEDPSLEYVAYYRSDSSDSLAWLYRLSGLWAGKEGSLLVWSFMTAVFGLMVLAKRKSRKKSKNRENEIPDSTLLDGLAAALVFLLVTTFVGALLFSEGGNPFRALPAEYMDGSGNLIGVAKLWGMSALLEHWGMAIHPPLLFVGYAGFSVPFAYAVAALMAGDSSNAWIVRSRKFALFAWLFLTAGIAVGALWAYTVLGWGGYWGWDAVENASLLPWLCGVALLHSFTVCRVTGEFRRWTLFAACLTFSFVAFDAFVTRSGIIGSVHSFAGDDASFALFLSLAVIPCLAGFVGIIVRWRSFLREKSGVADSIEVEEAARPIEFFSRATAYYFNNVIMVGMALLLGYVTLAPALPAWMPLGGSTLSADSFDAVAAPAGIAYLLLVAICPLLSWRKTGRAQVLRRLRVPGGCAAVLFVLLVVYQFGSLVPRLDGAVGVESNDALLAQMPSWCFHGLASAGFFVASLLLFTSLSMGLRGLRVRNIPHMGGAIVHLALSFVLIGLVGTTFYAIEEEASLFYNVDSDTADSPIVYDRYEFNLVSMKTTISENKTDLVNKVELAIAKDGEGAGSIAPAVQMVAQIRQQYFKSAIIRQPFEDVVVVYKGISRPESAGSDCTLLFEIAVNPLVSFLWVGFGLTGIGSMISLCGRGPACWSACPQRKGRG